MIFVTVGTHEQPFNRLIESVDRLKQEGVIQEEVIIQTGYSTFEPRYCKWNKFFSYNQMVQAVADARIVITHGGPASFLMPLQIGKIPVVVPRRHEFGEHINNHQVTFAQAVSERMGTILVVMDIDTLGNVLRNYEELIASMPSGLASNNAAFCEAFARLVEEILS